MLTRAEKEAIIGQIKDNISKSQAVFLTNLIGIPSNDAVKVRKGVRDASGGLVITRNTLLQKAAEGTMCEEIVKDLQGPHALAFAYEDSAAIAKVLHEAGKEFDPVELKAGVLDGKILTKSWLNSLRTRGLNSKCVKCKKSFQEGDVIIVRALGNDGRRRHFHAHCWQSLFI